MTQAFRGTPATVRALFSLTKFYCWSDRIPFYFKVNTDSDLVLPLPQIKINLLQIKIKLSQIKIKLPQII